MTTYQIKPGVFTSVKLVNLNTGEIGDLKPPTFVRPAGFPKEMEDIPFDFKGMEIGFELYARLAGTTIEQSISITIDAAPMGNLEAPRRITFEFDNQTLIGLVYPAAIKADPTAEINRAFREAYRWRPRE